MSLLYLFELNSKSSIPVPKSKFRKFALINIKIHIFLGEKLWNFLAIISYVVNNMGFPAGLAVKSPPAKQES